MRFALHTLTGRREDRLLFDHQSRMAKQFGYEDATTSSPSSSSCSDTTARCMDVSRLNEMLLQLFREAILTRARAPTVPLNPRFQIRNDYLEVTSDETSSAQSVGDAGAVPPAAGHTRDLRGVRATTIRLLGRHLWLIDEEFRAEPARITACSWRCCARRPASRTSCGA